MPPGLPTITISVDLDQRWGVRSRIAPVFHPVDHAFLHMPELVHRILVALEHRRLAATWFVPAALTCGSWDEYFAVSPDDPRALGDRYRITTAHRDMDPTGKLHFLPAVIEELVAGGVHEIASLGFSMLPIDLPGVTAADVVNELDASLRQITHATGRTVTSAAFADDRLAWSEAIERATGIERFRVAGRRRSIVDESYGSLSRRRQRPEGIGRTLGAALGSGRTAPPATVAVIGADLAGDASAFHWELTMRALARTASRIPAGDNLHVRWVTRPTQDRPFDIDLATVRFEQMLEIVGRGSERCGATVATMDQLAAARS